MYLDADDYQEGLDYDSDDYEHAWADLDSAPIRAASSRGSGSSSSVRLPPDRTADTAVSAAAPMSGASAAEQQQQEQEVRWPLCCFCCCRHSDRLPVPTP